LFLTSKYESGRTHLTPGTSETLKKIHENFLVPNILMNIISYKATTETEKFKEDKPLSLYDSSSDTRAPNA
jgi:hypothetical protein